MGRELVRRLDDPRVLTRSPDRAAAVLPGIDARPWEPEIERAPADALDGVDVVFNLAGEPLSEGRWTKARRRRIRDSRVLGTRQLVAGMASVGSKPKVLVSISAVGYYGNRGGQVLDESAPPGTGFLAEVCQDWEAEALRAEELGIRVVSVRMGVVLGPGGGAMARLLTPFRLGLGGRLADGGQWMSWIHLEDAVGVLLHAARSDAIVGAMNGVSPMPVTNAEFTAALAAAVHRPAPLPVPALALRLAFGDMSEVLTASQRVVPRVAQATGYHFEHAALADALARLLR